MTSVYIRWQSLEIVVDFEKPFEVRANDEELQTVCSLEDSEP
jgi:acyl carrier protein